MTQLQSDDFQRIQEMIFRSDERNIRENDRRFLEVAKQMEVLSARFEEGSKFYFQERETLEQKLSAKIHVVDQKVDALREEMEKRSRTTLSDIIKYILTFLLGGGLISLLEYLRVIGAH